LFLPCQFFSRIGRVSLLFDIDPLHFIDTVDGGDAVHGGLKFVHRMDFEVDGTYADMVNCLGPEADHRALELLRNAVHEVAEKMVSVDGADTDADRIETCAFFFKIDGDDGISMLGCESYGSLAIPFMDLYGAVGILESDDLVSWKRMAARTSLVAGFLLAGYV
jgi:hypothetical protein